jgi:hypothetical protein
MWTFLRRVLARSATLNSVLGDVVYEAPEVRGQSSRSFAQWRVKKGTKCDEYFVGLKMLPDAYAGAEGSPTNYMNFDIENAQRLRFNLDLCIAEYYRLTHQIPARRPPIS